VDWVHANSDAKFAMQIGHAGAKASTCVAWEGIDKPLESGNWPLLSASPQQYLPGISQTAQAMTQTDMDTVLAQFVASAKAAADIGVDWLELHCAHGYFPALFRR
jgi:anthraniloyl-CoA monooxygenase